MRLERRLCKHCHGGEHGNPRSPQSPGTWCGVPDGSASTRTSSSWRGDYITMVEEGDPGGAAALPAIVARIENDQVALSDTQLVMEDAAGNMLVYPEPADILDVLTRSIDQIQNQTRQDVTIDLSAAGAELLA